MDKELQYAKFGKYSIKKNIDSKSVKFFKKSFDKIVK